MSYQKVWFVSDPSIHPFFFVKTEMWVYFTYYIILCYFLEFWLFYFEMTTLWVIKASINHKFDWIWYKTTNVLETIKLFEISPGCCHPFYKNEGNMIWMSKTQNPTWSVFIVRMLYLYFKTKSCCVISVVESGGYFIHL